MRHCGATLAFLAFMFSVWLPAPISAISAVPVTFSTHFSSTGTVSRTSQNGFDTYSGHLDPVLVEERAVPLEPTIYTSARTDVSASADAEVWLPAGSPGNIKSAECDGDYFLVGDSGSADFGGVAGTISLWLKWTDNAASGRFWGQDQDFETRWSLGRLVLDWGGDGSLTGNKNDWVSNHWYFIAITWNETSNDLTIYWGDEETSPDVDAVASSWYSSTIGRHTENNIMNSAARVNAYTTGRIDEFRFFTVERTLEQLRSDYLSTLTGEEPFLSNYYEFEEDLTDTAGDDDLHPTGSCEYSLDVFRGSSGWLGSEVTVTVRDLQRLVALNGSFVNGNAGSNVDWFGDGIYAPFGWAARREIQSGLGRQRAAYYTSDDGYVTIENEGYEVSSPDGYRHYNGTRIYWYQTIENTEENEDFIFDFSYQYLHGPLGESFAGIFNFTVQVLNGSTELWSWSTDPTNMSGRGQWMSLGPTEFSLSEPLSVFELRISLCVQTLGGYVQIPVDDPDLDGDSTNGQYLTFLLDDVSLVAAERPSLDSVELTAMNSFAGIAAFSGNESHSSVVLNYTYWTFVLIPVTLSSNTTISFEFSAAVTRMSKFANSSRSTSSDTCGSLFSVNPNEPVSISWCFYVESYPEAEDLSLSIVHPADWTLSAVRDPLGLDVAQGCTTGIGRVTVPSGLVDSAGWWTFECSGPNYAYEVETELLSPQSSQWVVSGIYRSNSRIRCSANITTEASGVDRVLEAEFSIHDSEGLLWSSENASVSNSSLVYTTPLILGPVNASIGQWSAYVTWSNGTEVAYGLREFEVHHGITAFPHTPSVSIDDEEEFTAAVHLYDQDNGYVILSEAEVIGNLSSQIVAFSPNMARSWWEASFNVSALDAGSYMILINITIPFYDAAGCHIQLRIPDSESIYGVAFRAGFLGALALITVGIAATYGRQYYMSITARRNLELIQLKSRFDDVKNLIGFLAIQRLTGLSVYSKVLKGAFQESMLSSFISAISHFRDEFSMSEPTWKAIPITEAITAVQSEQLIFAIITVDPSSERLKENLEGFARSVGGLYDSDEKISKPTSLTSEVAEEVRHVMEPLFESYFDGALLDKYVGAKKNIPGNLKPVLEAMGTMEIDHGVSPEQIVRSVVLLGYGELRAYRCVLEAVTEGHLIPVRGGLPPFENSTLSSDLD